MRETPSRLDLQVGSVPDYQTFVRHLWSYEDEQGFRISGPPVVYRAFFEDSDPDWATIRCIAEYAMGCGGGDAIKLLPTSLDGLTPAWELQFGSMRALHVFCVLLGDRARVQGDEVATRIGEFIMWTLGFRWV